jgi:hypothetical protein
MPAPANATPTMTATDWMLLVFLSVLWGASFYFAKIAVAEIPPLTLALGRVAIAAAVLAIVARLVAGPFPRNPATWRQLAFMAALNNAIPFVLIFWGQIHISIGLASILNATAPLFGVVVAHVFTKDDRLNLNRIVGLVAGFTGVVVLIGPGLLHELGGAVWAEFACLAAACSYAFGAVLTRRLRTLSPVVVASGQLTCRPAAAAGRPAVRPAVIVVYGVGPGADGHDRAGSAVICARLSDLLPPDRPRRRHQCAANDVPDTGQRHPHRHRAAGRDAQRAATCRMAAIFVGSAAIDGRAGRVITRTLHRTDS